MELPVWANPGAFPPGSSSTFLWNHDSIIVQPFFLSALISIASCRHQLLFQFCKNARGSFKLSGDTEELYDFTGGSRHHTALSWP